MTTDTILNIEELLLLAKKIKEAENSLLNLKLNPPPYYEKFGSEFELQKDIKGKEEYAESLKSRYQEQLKLLK